MKWECQRCAEIWQDQRAYHYHLAHEHQHMHEWLDAWNEAVGNYQVCDCGESRLTP
jgi:hypothetical protein